MSNSDVVTRKPLRFIVTAEHCKSGVSAKGKPYRQQFVLVHQGDEVRKLDWFLRDNEPFLAPGEYQLANDAIYVADVVGQDGRSRPTIRVANRFVPVPVAKVEDFTAGAASVRAVK
eukprot:TRINITY_DN7667_c0_g2_i3.p2 TRINITY_DN7667_c0_g2~~TRINITY_DN7667_c0_g2_i3.p2  ORF type:complete len:116 (-),score=24.98 TRINITY_DN7667_c0_g2_i3:371-718(-)